MRLAPVLLVLTLAGCAGDTVARAPAPPVRTVTEPRNTNVALSEKEAFVVGVAVVAARNQCRARGRAVPAGQLRSNVNDLIRLARRKPDDIGTAFGEPKNTPRNGLRQVVEALEEGHCEPAIAETARDALESL